MSKTSLTPQPLNKVISRLLNSQWLLVSIIVILIIALASYFSGRNQIKSQQQSTLLLANTAGRYFENAVNVVQAIAASAPNQASLDTVQKSNPILDSLYVIRSSGELIAIAPKTSQLKIGMDMSGHPNFQDGLITKIISKPFISPRTGKTTIYISFPIINGGGILVGEFNLLGLEENLSTMNLHQGINFYITDSTGVFLSHPNYDLVKQQQNIGYLGLFKLENPTIEEHVIRDHGKLKISIVSKISQTGWYAITETSILSVYGAILYPAILGLILIGLLYWMIVRREREAIIKQVVNPISELDRIAMEMSRGNYLEDPKIIPSEAYTEIATLTSSFKSMQKAIQNHSEELRISEEKYRTVADFTYDWEAWRLPDGTYRYVSPSCERISGHKAQEFLDNPNLLVDLVVPEDKAIVEDHLRDIKADFHTPSHHIDFRITNTLGEVRWISHWCAAVYSDNGEFIGRRESNRDITDRKEKEIELEKWGQIFENAEWGIAIGSADGKTVELINPAYARMHGYEPEELTGLNIPDLYAPECRGEIAKNIELTHQKGHHIWESRHIHKDGHAFPVEIDATAVKDKNGEVKYRVVNVQDLTEKKKIESALRASETKFSTAFRTSPDSVNINRLNDGLYIEINEGYTLLTGYTRDDVAGKTSLEIDIWVNPDDRKRLVKGLQEEGIVNNLEAPFRCKDGQIKTCLMSARVIDIGGETCILSMTRDITDRINSENRLKESEEKFAKVFHEAPVWISIADFETGVYLDVNEEAIRATGFTREEAIGHTAEEIGLFKKGDRKRIFDEVRKKGRVIDLEMTFTAKDGSLLYGLLNAEKMVVNSRECLLTIVNEITERKKNEEQLELLKYSIDTSFDCAYWMDIQGNFIYANEAACRILGYTHEELLKMHVSAINPKATPERWAQVVDMLIEKKNITIESTHRRKDGTEFPVELSSGYLKFGDQEYVNGFAKDITERKQAEVALQESVEYFKATFENANIGACLLGLNGEFININDEFCRIVGFSRTELLKLTFNDITHPDDKSIGLEIHKKMLANISNQGRFDKRYINKKGEVVWVRISNASVRDEKGGLKYVVAYVQDITEEKRAEDIIKESEANLKNAQKYAHIGSWVWDIKANHLEWSDEMFNIFGIDKTKFTGNLQEVITNAIHPDDREKVEESNRSVIEQGKPIPLEYRIIRPDGSVRVVWAEAGELILDDKGAFSLLKGTVQDITYRKRIEQSLAESEERYRLVDESSQDLIYSYDRQSRFSHANSTMCKTLGLKLEEIIGKTHEELGFPQEQCDEWARLHKQVYLTNSTVISETVTPIHGGAPLFFEVVLNPIHDSTGAIIGIAGTTRDINARKQAELKVNEQLDELKRWYEVTLNRESRILELKHEVNQLLTEEQKPIRYPSAEEDHLK